MAEIVGQVFDGFAEQYDRFRPSYPRALAEFVKGYAGAPRGDCREILEVGCGSGQATRIFADSASNVTCVDPSPRLIAIARENLRHVPYVSFVVSTVEDAPLARNSFDMVIAGQSFHWVDQGNGYARVHRLLRPEGTVALFWNSLVYSGSPVEDALFEINRTLLQDIHAADTWNECVATTHNNDYDRFVHSGYFVDPVIKTFDWTLDYSPEQYCGLQMTYSANSELSDEKKRSLVAAYTEAMIKCGGTLRMTYRTYLYLGKRASL